MKSSVLRIVLMVAGGIALGLGLAFLLGFVVQALWNWLLPDLFGLPEITYWQAWGLLILAHLLLGGGPRIQHKNHREHDDGFRKRLCESIGKPRGPEPETAG